jgi:hypothetical protein
LAGDVCYAYSSLQERQHCIPTRVLDWSYDAGSWRELEKVP